MYLKSNSKRDVTLTMPWLVGGPYMFTAGGTSEVFDADGNVLLKENPRMFSLVVPVKQQADETEHTQRKIRKKREA